MNLDLLISKYLDGELTPEEDFTLRELIKADPASRSIFDDYIEMQMEIQNDAKSIKLPEKLKRATEDTVMMEIMKATPVVIHRIEPVTSRRKYPQFISLVAALLLFFVFNIYDGKTPFENLNFVSNPNANRSDMPLFSQSGISNNAVAKKSNANEANVNFNRKINQKSSLTNNQFVTKIDNTLIIENNSNSQNYVANTETVESSNKTVAEISSNTAMVDQVPSIKDDKSVSSNIERERKQNPTSLQMNLPISNGSIYGDFGMANQLYYDFNYEKHNIVLTSIYSRDFTRSGLSTSNNSSIIHYAQSIGVEVSENSKIGIEFGISEFQFDKRKFVRIPAGVSGSEYKSSNSTEVLEPDNDSGYLYVPVNVASNHQLYWGTMFFEQGWINYGGLMLESRIGFGFSGSGYLAFGRANLKYDIYNGICLTFGTEGRLFSTGGIDKNIDAISKSLGLVYGLQFKF